MDFINDSIYAENPVLEFKKREYVYLSSITHLEIELEKLRNTFSGIPIERLNSIANHEKDTNMELLDGIPVHPLVKLELERLKREVQEKDILLETATTEMNVATFDTQSLIGQRLVLKCKVLQEENKYLGKKILSLKSCNSNSSNNCEYHDFLEAEIKKLHCIIEDLEAENERLNSAIKSLTVLNTATSSNKSEKSYTDHRNNKSEKLDKYEKSSRYDKYDRYEDRSDRSKHSTRDKSHSSRRDREIDYSRRSPSKSSYRSRSYRSPHHSSRGHSHSRRRHHS